MTQPPKLPDSVDASTPNVARMYDYYLGGKDHYAVDQAAAEEVLTAAPEVRTAVRENRGFLTRAVSHLAGAAGITQFLDIGTGLPTQNNVHEVAQRLTPDARVVYVDHDPVVVRYGQALLADETTTAVIEGDLRRPDEILRHPTTLRLLDFTRPVAVLLVAVLNFVPDQDQPATILSRLRAAMAPGSYLVISHGASEDNPQRATSISRVYQKTSARAAMRTRDEILPFFDGFTLLPPGLVYASQWQAETSMPVGDAGTAMTLAGVGRLDA